MEKTTSEKVEQSELNADGRRLIRALDSLGLVDSLLDQDAWIARVTEQVGDDIANQWYEFADGASDVESEYAFTYGAFEKAKHFSVGWRSGPLAAECAWMLPRLRDAIDRSGHPEPFLVEVPSWVICLSALSFRLRAHPEWS